MPVKRSSFPAPRANPRPSRQYKRFTPFAGVDYSLTPEELSPAHVAESWNFIPTPDSRAMMRRYALQEVTTQPQAAENQLLGMYYSIDSSGDQRLLTVSATSVWRWNSDFAAAVGTAQPSTFSLSGSTDYLDMVGIRQSNQSFQIVYTNGVDLPHNIDLDTGTISALLFSADSYAKAVGMVDERLVFFNTSGSGGAKHPLRVAWTARGNTAVGTIGEGFQDLSEAKGTGVAIVAWGEGAILLTSEEVWRMIPRRDTFAFDFQRISTSDGCTLFRTAKATPEGVVYLGKDNNFRRATFNGVQIIGAPVQPWLQTLDDTYGSTNRGERFAGYDPQYDTYHFYWRPSNASTHTWLYGLQYKNSFWYPQRFASSIVQPVVSDHSLLMVEHVDGPAAPTSTMSTVLLRPQNADLDYSTRNSATSSKFSAHMVLPNLNTRDILAPVAPTETWIQARDRAGRQLTGLHVVGVQDNIEDPGITSDISSFATTALPQVNSTISHLHVPMQTVARREAKVAITTNESQIEFRRIIVGYEEKTGHF